MPLTDEERAAIFKFWWNAGDQPGPWVGFDEYGWNAEGEDE